MEELAKQDHTYHLSKEEFNTYQGQWYLTLNESGKDATLTIFSTCSVFQKTVRKLQNQHLHSNTGDGILPQVIPGGTGARPKVGGAHDKIFKRTLHLFFLLQLVSFTVDDDPL